MMNKVLLEGRPTKNPVFEITESNAERISFVLACNGYNQNKEADFIKCFGWEKVAKLVRDYVIKGMLISVEGQLRSYTYDDAVSGQRCHVSYIKLDRVNFLESKEDCLKRRKERELDSVAVDEADTINNADVGH